MQSVTLSFTRLPSLQYLLVLRALQVADRGRIGQRLSQERGRLRPLKSGASETGGVKQYQELTIYQYQELTPL